LIDNIFSQVSGQVIEVKTPLTHRDYTHLLDQQDPLHLTVNKIRRCFLYNNQYFQVKKCFLGVGVAQLSVGVTLHSLQCGTAGLFACLS
jgi:hypothetical protein